MLVKNGSVLKFDKYNTIVKNGAVYIKDGIIQEVGPSQQLEHKYEHEEQIDAGGNYIMPGMVCSHFHTYSAFSRGMNIGGDPSKNFLQILQNLWWRLDKKLSMEDIYYSGLVSAIEAVKHGTTSIVDHHCSPYACRGSLNELSRAFESIGVRGNYCYEVSERDGMEIAEEGLKENYDFIKRCRENKNSLITGSFGVHAAFTVSDETFKRAVEMQRELGCGFHIHVSEGMADEDINQYRYRKSVVKRLYDLGVLGEKTIAVHGVNIDKDDIEILKNSDTMVVHNPESNMNNAVGLPDVSYMLDRGVLVGFGTDGFTTDMFREIQTAYVVHKMIKKDPSAMGLDSIEKMAFYNNGEIINRLFGKPAGAIEKGCFGDVIIVDYKDYTPVSGDNILGHLVFGMGASNVVSTIINGKIIMENRKLKNIDEDKIITKARSLSEKLWKRI
ncbi:putative aminohydrolase SsnA [Clostridium tyrobutyricum]|uniref:putative aminohydrolase SsnA n=1 Tax=Clostridium tyrobutyricum TaxID=1519 RepID=UPI001C383FA2|nr:putative aminohydrolase SsnA [Clostridium tyrobutyricum]MBV4420143.1 putative aminohydrolase SsnA [Clostridium tyrobutyricum]